MSVLIPLIVLTITFFLSAIPLGLPADATFAPPMMMLAALFVCASRSATRYPPWMAMLFGIVTDIVTASPLGYWGLLALLAYAAGSAIEDEKWAERFPVLWLMWLMTGAVIGLTAWCIASVYFFRWIGWQPIAMGAGLSLLGFPLVVGAVRLLRAALPRPRTGTGAGAL